MDPVDPDSDPDPQHCGIVLKLYIHIFFTREFVNYNQNARNSINVTKTLATKHQKNLASRYEYLYS